MNDEVRKILKTSLYGTIGFMWVVGGIATVLKLFDMFWLLGWISLFVWVWGCWAGAIYFDVKKYLR